MSRSRTRRPILNSGTQQVTEWTAVVADAAQECSKIVEQFRSESFSVLSFYRLEAVGREQATFAPVDATVQPAIASVAAVGEALQKGLATWKHCV
jgi:hypothetical protein